MKKWLLIGLLLLSGGCRKVEVHTKVQSDGSLERTVILHGDSSDVRSCAYPLPSDESWNISQPADEDSGVYIARKQFARASDINREFDLSGIDSLRINSRVELDKKFRGFYTVLSYRETFYATSPFRKTLFNTVLTEEEGVRFFSGEVDSILEAKLEKWETLVALEEFYQILLRGAEQLDDPALPPAAIRERKDALFEALEDMDIQDSDEVYLNGLLETSEEVLGSPAVWRLKERIAPFADILARYSRLLENAITEEYENIVEVPGVILDTNASQLEGNRVAWQFDVEDFHLRDKEMWVESRLVNRTLIAAAAFTVLMLVIALAAGTLAARRRSGI